MQSSLHVSVTERRVYESCSRTGKYLISEQISSKANATHSSSQVLRSSLACGTAYPISGLSAEAEVIRPRNTRRTFFLVHTKLYSTL